MEDGAVQGHIAGLYLEGRGEQSLTILKGTQGNSEHWLHRETSDNKVIEHYKF